jgi:hypothetical protein
MKLIYTLLFGNAESKLFQILALFRKSEIMKLNLQLFQMPKGGDYTTILVVPFMLNHRFEDFYLNTTTMKCLRINLLLTWEKML